MISGSNHRVIFQDLITTECDNYFECCSAKESDLGFGLFEHW